MSDLLKTVRITDNIKYELYKKGSSKKYTIAYLDKEIKSQYYDFTLSDDFVVKESLIELARVNNKKSDYYKIIQNPYKDPYIKRVYGSPNYPYYLNNTCKIVIEWIGKYPNPEFQLGPYSTADEATYFNKQLNIERWIDGNVTNSVDNGESNITSTWNDVNGNFDRATISYKKALLYLPDNTILIQTQSGLVYNNDSVEFIKYSANVKDSDIIDNVIINYVKMIVNNKGISYDDYKLKLCDPDSEYCSIIPYINPFEVKVIQDIPIEEPTIDTKININTITIDGLSSNIHIKEKTDLPTFTIWLGNKPILNGDELDVEYIESNSSIS